MTMLLLMNKLKYQPLIKYRENLLIQAIKHDKKGEKSIKSKVKFVSNLADQGLLKP